MTPEFRIKVDGRQDATEAIRNRLLSLTVTDEAGEQSDSVEIRVDDRDNAVLLPRHGSELTVSLGWKDGKFTPVGRYVVDETGLEGPPDTMVIRARGADMRQSLKARKTRSWEDVSLGGLVSQIASEHGLEGSVASSLRSIRIAHLDQTEESDLHLLTRLARDYDAIAKPAAGKLLLAPRGQAASASGKPMPTLDVVPGDASRWRVSLADRGEYRAVRARWRDAEAAGSVTEERGSGDPVYVLRRLYPTSAEAREAARAKLEALSRGTGRLSITLTPGRPEVAAEAALRLGDFRKGLDGRWICMRVTHKLDSSGYSTSVQAELPTS